MANIFSEAGEANKKWDSDGLPLSNERWDGALWGITKYDEVFNTYGLIWKKKTCLLFPAAKVNTPKAATANACNHPSKTSCHTSCHLQLKKLHTKNTLETNNGVENATRACKSVSLQLFVENKMPQKDCLLTELALSPCYHEFEEGDDDTWLVINDWRIE